MRSVDLYIGGDAPWPPTDHPWLSDHRADDIVAVDSGFDLAQALGQQVTVVVGDGDSMSSGSRAAVVAQGLDWTIAPTDKDETDLELGLDAVLGPAVGTGAAADPTIVTVFGGLGGRLDHLLTIIGILGGRALAGTSVRAAIGTTTLRFVAAPRSESVPGRVGDTVSVIPLFGRAVVSLRGMRWPLDAAALLPTQGRGMSNQLTADVGTVHVHEGLAVVTTQWPSSTNSLTPKDQPQREDGFS